MKKNLILIATVFTLSSAYAKTIVFDDFSGGTAGNSILNRQDPTGVGTWTDGGILKGASYGDGNYVVSPTGGNGGAVLEGNFSQAGMGVGSRKVTLSLDLTPRGHTLASNAQLTIGLFNTINKGVLANLDNSSTNLVSYKIIFQNTGGNEGKCVWNVRENGGNNTTTWFGDGQEMGTNTFTMTLTYNYDTGSVEAAVLDKVSGDTLVSATTTTAAGLSFSSVGFGWAGLPTTDTSITDLSRVTNFKVVSDAGTIRLISITSP